MAFKLSWKARSILLALPFKHFIMVVNTSTAQNASTKECQYTCEEK